MTIPTTPDWDFEQVEVIMEGPEAWQLVTAGPGAGKSAVACQRVAYLIDAGIPASRILLISFTRTAVAELRDRIVSYAVAGERARSVRIATIDSHAWSLRAWIDDEPLPKVLADNSFELAIERTVDLFRSREPGLCEFMETLEHLIIDEAQDVMGVRADLLIEMLLSLGKQCGVTILADPAQAIYGFTTDDRDDAKQNTSLLSRIKTDCPRVLAERTLKNLHRIKNNELVDLFLRTRKEIELADNAVGHVDRVQQVIRETCGKDIGLKKHSSIADFLAGAQNESLLVLFRRRADVLFASSYCSDAGVHHRLRMSDLPVVVRPWLGWLFGEAVQPFINHDEFDKLWEMRAGLAAAPFEGESRDAAWSVLHQFAAGIRPRTIDLVQLRRVVSRGRPLVEFCYPELGAGGPILGTIHASKGREADTVVLFMRPYDAEQHRVAQEQDSGGGEITGARGNGRVFRRSISEPHEDESARDDEEEVSKVSTFEEGRVYYVGATRARKMLYAAGATSTGVSYLDSKRVYRSYGATRAQLEIGRDGDVDPLAHLAWANRVDLQRILAQCVGTTHEIQARAQALERYDLRLLLERSQSLAFLFEGQ